MRLEQHPRKPLPSHFKPKPRSQADLEDTFGDKAGDYMSLEWQVNRAALFASRKEETLWPPSVDVEDIYAADPRDLRQQFPARMRRQAEILRYDGVVRRRHGQHKEVPRPKIEEWDPKTKQLVQREKTKIELQREYGHWFFMMNALDRYIEQHRAEQTLLDAGQASPELDEKKRLLERQLSSFIKYQEYLEKDNSAGYFKLPTGFGKTVLFSKIVEAMNTSPERESGHMEAVSRTRTLILVPTTDLITNTAKELNMFAPDVQVHEVRNGRKLQLDQGTTIMTYPMFRSLTKRGKITSADFDFVVLDEAHEATGRDTAQRLQPFLRDCTVAAFTATPEYSAEKGVAKLLGVDGPIDSLDINQAVDARLISDFTAMVFEADIDVTDAQVGSDGEYTEESLEKLIDFQARAAIAAELYMERFNGMQGYVFCEGVTAAGITADVFNEMGIPSAVVTATTPAGEREEIWQRFERGEIKMLMNVGIYTRGANHPPAALCLNLAATGSIVRAPQRGGRAVRLDRSNPDKHAYIVDWIYIDKSARKRKQITFADVAKREAQVISMRSSGEGRSFNVRDNKPDAEGKSAATPDLASLGDFSSTVSHVESVTLEGTTTAEELEFTVTDIVYSIDRLVNNVTNNPLVVGALHSLETQVQGDEELEDFYAADIDTLRNGVFLLNGLSEHAYSIIEPLTDPTADVSVQLLESMRAKLGEVLSSAEELYASIQISAGEAGVNIGEYEDEADNDGEQSVVA